MRKRALTIAAVVVGVAILLPLLALVFAYSIANSFNNAFSHIGENHRKRLDPIAIDHDACPYVVLTHTAARNFQQAEPRLFGDFYDSNGSQRMLAWPEGRDRLERATHALQTAIEISKPHFPLPIRQQLNVSLRALRVGRAQLAQAHDGTDLINRTQATRDRGAFAFAYASDLVGDQCDVVLAV